MDDTATHAVRHAGPHAGPDADAVPSAVPGRRVCVISAWTTDYLPGYLTGPVNERWARRHGYDWRADVLAPDEMRAAIGPERDHGTWYKVLMINQLLGDGGPAYSHVVWLDADACVVDPTGTIDRFIVASGDRDLVVAEDMTPVCKVNCGVLIIK